MKLETILVPTDLEPTSDPGVRAAVGLASEVGAKLVFVHVLTARAIDTDDVPHAARPLRQEALAEATESLAELVATVGAGVQADTEVVFGDPAMEILVAADAHDADVIVITVKNRSRVGKLLMGSHAQQVILSSHRPVLTIPRE